MFCVQGLDWALVWKFMSAFLSIVLERFEEEMKFDVMPTGTSVLESKSGWERKGGGPTNTTDDRLKPTCCHFGSCLAPCETMWTCCFRRVPPDSRASDMKAWVQECGPRQVDWGDQEEWNNGNWQSHPKGQLLCWWLPLWAIKAESHRSLCRNHMEYASEFSTFCTEDGIMYPLAPLSHWSRITPWEC